jgi:hypothetical protein
MSKSQPVQEKPKFQFKVKSLDKIKIIILTEVSYLDLKEECRARFEIEGDFHFLSDNEHTYVQVNSQSTLE